METSLSSLEHPYDVWRDKVTAVQAKVIILCWGWSSKESWQMAKCRSKGDTGRLKEWVDHHLDSGLRLTHVYLLDVYLFVCLFWHLKSATWACAVCTLGAHHRFLSLTQSLHAILEHSETSSSSKQKPECHPWGFSLPQTMFLESPANSTFKIYQESARHLFTSPQMASISP